MLVRTGVYPPVKSDCHIPWTHASVKLVAEHLACQSTRIDVRNHYSEFGVRFYDDIKCPAVRIRKFRNFDCRLFQGDGIVISFLLHLKFPVLTVFELELDEFRPRLGLECGVNKNPALRA